MARVHSALPTRLTDAVDEVLQGAGIEHVAHDDAMRGAEAAASDADALAFVGPWLSQDVAHAAEATAPAGLPLLAPVATWVGVTREDEPGCDDPARGDGTIFRLLARDLVVAQRLATEARASGSRALVIAGEHDYGRQLDGQLRLASLPRATGTTDATMVVLCGLAGEPEIERAAAVDLPLVAFDGVQGSDLGERDVFLALPFAPIEGAGFEDTLRGIPNARRAAELIVESGAASRGELLAWLQARDDFDEHGDPVDPPVSLWRAGPDWALEPHRPLSPG